MVVGLLIALLEVAICVVVALGVTLLLWVAELGGNVRQQVRARNRLQYDRYRAEIAIRDFKRRATSEMLEVERRYRQRDPLAEIIEEVAKELEAGTP